MTSIKSLALEALICGAVYICTRDFYLVNCILYGFGVWHIIEEYRDNHTLISLKSLLSWAVIVLSLATACFRTLSFIKWKASVALLMTSCIVLYSPYLWPKSIGEVLLKKIVKLDVSEARAINDIFGFLLLAMSVLNLLIVAYLTDSEWVWFKTILLPIIFTAFGALVFFVYIDKRHTETEEA
jgi:intracellular septation protein A